MLNLRQGRHSTQILLLNKGNIHLCNVYRKFCIHFKSISNSTTSITADDSSSSSSFALSYLINKCSLPPEAALKAAKKVDFKTPQRPDSLLKYLRKRGFTNPQITNLILKRPSILLTDPKKTIHPKLQFLNQLGFTDPEVAKLVTTGDTSFLGRSLKRLIIPSFHFLKTLLHTDEKVALAIRRSFSIEILQLNLQKDILPRVQILRDQGVPKEFIPTFLMCGRRVLFPSTDVFSETVKEAIALGFNPSDKMFIYALCRMLGTSKAKRESRFEIFRDFGWSEDEIRRLMRNQPACMATSSEKIRRVLDLFMNSMKWEPARLAKTSNMFCLSFEKRVIPRVRYIEYLISKGLVRDDIKIATVLVLTEAKFNKKFVAKYAYEYPEVTKLYKVTQVRADTEEVSENLRVKQFDHGLNC